MAKEKNLGKSKLIVCHGDITEWQKNSYVIFNNINAVKN
jgi:hypothetical protein